MGIENNFLQQDYQQAKSEINCIKSCNKMLDESLQSSDFTSARIAAEDIVKSLKELEKFNCRKKEEEKWELFKEELLSKNINIEQVKRFERMVHGIE